MTTSPEVRDFLRAIGQKGGRAKSARKLAASRANGKLSQIPQPTAVPPVEHRSVSPTPQRPAVLIVPRPEGK